MSATITIVNLPPDFRFSESNLNDEAKEKLKSKDFTIAAFNTALDALQEDGVLDSDDNQLYNTIIDCIPKEYIVGLYYSGGWESMLICLPLRCT